MDLTVSGSSQNVDVSVYDAENAGNTITNTIIVLDDQLHQQSTGYG